MENYYEIFKLNNPWYNAIPSYKNTDCPISYKLEECSSFENGYCCRTCTNYNPIRILIKYKNNETGIPYTVLGGDAEYQLKNFVK